MKDIKDTLLTMLTPMLWGSTYIITTIFLPIDRPIFVALMRGFPIGLILLLYYRQFPKGEWIYKSVLLGTLNIGAFFLVLFIAAYRLPGGIASIIGSIQPVFIILLSWLFLKEKPTKNSYLAIAITVLGVYLLLFQQHKSLDALGIFAAVLGAIIMAFGVVLTKYFGKPKEVSQMVFTAWQLFFGSLILIPVALIFEKPVQALSVTNIAGLVILGVLNTGVGYYLWFRGIEKLGPIKVSFLGPINPMTAFFLGYIILGQRVNKIQILGVICILLGVFVSQKRSKKTNS